MQNNENRKSRQVRPPDPIAALFAPPGQGRALLDLSAKRTVFAQGDPADALYYLRRGHVQLAIVSSQGKEAVVAILNAGDFFGESCIGGHATYHSSAITMTPCSIVRIERDAMLRLLDEQPAMLDAFMKFLLTRSCRIEADLADQILNSTERRLARALSLLADLANMGIGTQAEIPRISQEVLAAKVGTTRSRINVLMNKFRKSGLIEYSHASRICVRPALLNAVAEDSGAERPADVRPLSKQGATRPEPATSKQAKRWRMQAEEYRTVSEGIRTPSAKDTYVRLARTYEALADRAERRVERSPREQHAGRKNLAG